MKYKLETWEFECEYCGTKAQATCRIDPQTSLRYLIPDTWHLEECTDVLSRETRIVHMCPACHKRRTA